MADDCVPKVTPGENEAAPRTSPSSPLLLSLAQRDRLKGLRPGSSRHARSHTSFVSRALRYRVIRRAPGKRDDFPTAVVTRKIVVCDRHKGEVDDESFIGHERVRSEVTNVSPLIEIRASFATAAKAFGNVRFSCITHRMFTPMWRRARERWLLSHEELRLVHIVVIHRLSIHPAGMI